MTDKRTAAHKSTRQNSEWVRAKANAEGLPTPEERDLASSVAEALEHSDAFLELTMGRRGFCALLGVGALAALGLEPTLIRALGDNQVLAIAWADEQGDKNVIIHVVTPGDMPVVAWDMSLESLTPRVPDVKVQVRSRYNGETAEGTTGREGFVALDIRELSEDPSWLDPTGMVSGGYEFWGSLLAEKEGYRTYETGRMRIVGGTIVDIATEPHGNLPYLRCLTFDETDIQYAKDAAFYLAKGNDVEHEVLVKLANCSGTATVQISQGTYKASASQEADDSGIATISLKGAFLAEGHEDAFTVGEPLYVHVTCKDASKTEAVLDVISTMTVLESYIDGGSSDSGEMGMNIPGSSSGSIPSFFKMPDDVPLLGGQKINMWFPASPIVFQTAPNFTYIGATFSGSLIRGDEGGNFEDGWKRNTRKTGKDAIDRGRASWNETWQQFLATPYSGSSLARGYASPVSTQISVNVEAGLMALLEWVVDEGRLQGDMQLFCTASVDVALQQQYVLCSVPCFIRFEFRLGLMLLVDLGLSMGDPNDPFGSMMAMSANMGATTNFTISAALTVGVGVAGIASIGVRGCFYISFSLAFHTIKEKPSPHVVATVGASVSWVVQFCLFKASGTIVDKELTGTDNWKDEQVTETIVPRTDELRLLMPDGSLGYPVQGDPNDVGIESAQVVTGTELGALAELRGTPSGANSDEPFQFEEARSQSATTGNPCQLGGVRALGENGAKVTETLVYKDVFSDPRVQIVSSNGRLFALRIVPVVLDGVGERTRLTCAAFNSETSTWGQPQVLEFEFEDKYKKPPLTVKRSDVFDYSFDAKEQGRTGDVWVSLVCGARPHGDKSTFEEVANATMPVLLKLQGTDMLKVKEQLPVTVLDESRASGHITFCKKTSVLPVYDADTNTDYGAFVAYMYLYWLPGSSDIKYESNMWVAGMWPFGTPYTITYDDLKRSTSAFHKESASISDIDMHVELIDINRNNEKGTTSVHIAYGMVGWLSRTTTDPFGLGILTAELVFKDGTDGPNFDWDSLQEWYDPDGVVPDCRTCVPSPATGGYLCPSSAGLKHVDALTFEVRDVGFDERLDLGRCAMSQEGDMLYYTTVIDGPGPGSLDENAEYVPGPDLKRYQLWAATAIVDAEGTHRFVEPYPLAELEHAADQVKHVRMSDYEGFLFTSITDMSTSKSDIYFCAVPRIVCVTLLAFSSENLLVCAGREEAFLVSVRNDGNTSVSSFTLILSDGQGLSERIEVNIPDVESVPTVRNIDPVAAGLADVLSAEDAPRFVECPPVEDAPTRAGVMLPSEERRYRFIWKIPEEWDGDVELTVTIDPESPKVSDVAGASEPPGVADRAVRAYGEGGLGLQAPEPQKVMLSTMLVQADPNNLTVVRNAYGRNGEMPQPPITFESNAEAPVSAAAVATVAAVAALGAGGVAAAVHASHVAAGKVAQVGAGLGGEASANVGEATSPGDAPAEVGEATSSGDAPAEAAPAVSPGEAPGVGEDASVEDAAAGTAK